jgi:hypothetical protein
MAARTVPALALRPTGNLQGVFFFLSLVSGRTITRGLQSYTTLPMSHSIMDQINAMDEQAGDPGVYFSEAADEVPYFPDDDNTVPDDDHILEDDVVSISASEEDEWIPVRPSTGAAVTARLAAQLATRNTQLTTANHNSQHFPVCTTMAATLMASCTRKTMSTNIAMSMKLSLTMMMHLLTMTILSLIMSLLTTGVENLSSGRRK